MATQWTAGLTDNTVLPASTLNTIGAAWETWTPTVVQGATTFGTTIAYAKYARLQKIVVAVYGLTIASGTGTAANSITVSLPIALASTVNQGIGSAWIYDSSATQPYAGIATVLTSTSVLFIGDWSGGASWGTTPAIQFAVNDQIRGFFIYEAA